jgi:hypothetical protein
MSYPNIALDTISEGQDSKEVTANNLFEAESPAALFGCDAANTTGLTFGYYGGVMFVDGAVTAISSGTVMLTASQTNYVEATYAGVVSANTTAFTAGRIPLYTIATGTSSISSVTPARAFVEPSYITQNAAVTINSADVTLTAAQARCRFITLTGTLTGDRNLIVPNRGEWVVINNTAGAYAVTVKTASGTGETVAQSSNKQFYADGTNVVATTIGSAGSTNSFTTIAVSGQSDVVADSSSDTLTLVAGSGVTLTTNAGADSITIAASGSSSGITLGTPVASTSGTSVEFTSLPSGIKAITMTFSGVSTSGTDEWLVQIGDSGGFETTGYSSISTLLQGASGVTQTTSTSGFLIKANGSGDVYHGAITLRLLDSATNTWSCGEGGLMRSGSPNQHASCAGDKSLSAELDRIRVTTTGGTQTFDAGKINIQYQ